MSKNSGESTHFTSMGVWAHTRPAKRATVLEFPDGIPKNETPLQKVKRLREAANRAKMAQVTNWDYIYLYGRIAADTAHRFTVYGLIFATGCIGVLSVFSIGDMIVYNRRKRNIYYAEEARLNAEMLDVARKAVKAGTATPVQAALVIGIAEEEAEMLKIKAERNWRSRIIWWFYGEWNEDSRVKEQRALAVEDLRKAQAQQKQDLGIVSAVQEARAGASENINTATQAAEKTGKGWLGWMMGSSKKE